MNTPTDNSKFVPLKWFVFIIKYLPLLAGTYACAKSELPYSTHTCKD